MPKRYFKTLEDFKRNLHREGASLVEVSGSKIPCILVDRQTYESILSKSFGQTFAADTLLDIFYDGRDVFVDVQVNLRARSSSNYFLEANYLLYANDMIEFFETLAETGMLAIAPDPQSNTNSNNVPVIQLPNRDAALRALQIIKSNATPRKTMI